MGEMVYAGGKQTGGAIEILVIKEVAQSYLTRLWSADAFKKNSEPKSISFVHLLSRYFTIILFTIATSCCNLLGISRRFKSMERDHGRFNCSLPLRPVAFKHVHQW